MPGRENGGQREPAVQDFLWVGEEYPGKQDFISCLLLKAGISSWASAQESLSQGLIQYLAQKG